MFFKISGFPLQLSPLSPDPVGIQNKFLSPVHNSKLPPFFYFFRINRPSTPPPDRWIGEATISNLIWSGPWYACQLSAIAILITYLVQDIHVKIERSGIRAQDLSHPSVNHTTRPASHNWEQQSFVLSANKTLLNYLVHLLPPPDGQIREVTSSNLIWSGPWYAYKLSSSYLIWKCTN